jgi:orotate phosphoribosyltransferase
VTAHKTATQKEQLAKLFVDTKSFLWSDTPIFQLASGGVSNFYIDSKILFSYPEALEVLGEMIATEIGPQDIDAVGGLELGAVPIAYAVSVAFRRKFNKCVRAFVVRKEPKKHGLKKPIEGAVSQGDRVLIVDDVITTGTSTIDAINKSREQGLDVVKVIAVVDRLEKDGAQNIRDCGVTFDSLLTVRDLCDFRGVTMPPSQVLNI